MEASVDRHERPCVVIFGGSAGARLAYDSLELRGISTVFAACYVKEEEWGTVPGVTDGLVVGAEADGVERLMKDPNLGWFVATGNNSERGRISERIFEAVQRQSDSVVHPSASVSKHAHLGEGCLVSAGAIIQVGARVGRGCIIASRAVVEHDCVIGDFAQICPSVTLTGRIHVGRGAFIGAGSTIVPNISIGQGALIAAGSVVIHDVPPGVMVAGVPAVEKRPVKENEI
eukprot:TRINITY_DN6918_c0_g1_i1.p1 TRINITY_DN6918_c0_g1~~TRINITY_DN6918_c0_g1_i1.p1  ORF type:complete len:230 (-),score=22.90 TRINITY_DN6918_c0_g1_i1:121-810(-)